MRRKKTNINSVLKILMLLLLFKLKNIYLYILHNAALTKNIILFNPLILCNRQFPYLISYLSNYNREMIIKNCWSYRTFLREMPRDTVSFKRPEQVYHARWIAKAIYCLKVFIFRDEFVFSYRELYGLRQFCFFIVYIVFKSLVFIYFCEYYC